MSSANRWVALGVGLLALAAGSLAGAQTTRPPFAALVDQVRALFPKVEGEVIEVRGGELTLSLGRRDGLQAGIELSLFREGRELRHPKSGELLGRVEQPLGRVSVSQVFEAYSVATLLPGVEARPADKVRLSAGKIRLTLLPLSSGEKEGQVEAAVQELSEELDRTGRFQVMMGDQVNVFLAQERIKAEEAIEGKGLETAAKRFNVEHLLILLFKRVEKKPYMEVRLFSYPGAAPLLSTALFVSPSVKPQPKAQFSADPQPRPGPPPKQRSLLARLLGGELEAGSYSSGEASIPLKEAARFGFPVLGMDVAVAPRDKVARLVVTDGDRVFLSRIVNRALDPEWTYSPRPLGRIVSVQLADLDGDGVLEVVVNRYVQHEQAGGFTSFILTTRGGKAAVVVENIGEILLAVDASGEGIKQTLWAQPFTPDGFFQKGRAERVVLKSGALVRNAPVRVPHDFRATGATLSNIAGKETRALAYIDEANRLVIALDGQETWRSATRVGGGGYLKVEVVKQMGLTTRSYFYTLEPLPLAVDLDGDGIEEILIPQNQTEGHLAAVFRGPAGYRLQSINSGFEGAITGLGAISGDTPPTLIAAVVRFKGLLKTSGETQVIMTSGE
ncbi:MAG: hypothetical protein HY725_14955 [Candidatus Rokubacteria bacterium]|nr:hypothetical protein [Candidatus Rokubacteria bacterium]